MVCAERDQIEKEQLVWFEAASEPDSMVLTNDQDQNL